VIAAFWGRIHNSVWDRTPAVWVTAPDGTRLHVLEQGKGDAVLWLQG